MGKIICVDGIGPGYRHVPAELNAVKLRSHGPEHPSLRENGVSWARQLTAKYTAPRRVRDSR